MKRLFIPLMTFILSFSGWLKTKSQESDNTIDDCHNNFYLDSISHLGGERSRHYSHGSAHHYSAVTYAKTIKSNFIKQISKSESELLKMDEVLSLEHMPSDGRRIAKCRISQISYVDLLSINDIEINKRCYMISYLSEYLSESSHSHTYCTFYFVEDGTTYYRTQPYVKSGEINELKWATQILELIK